MLLILIKILSKLVIAFIAQFACEKRMNSLIISKLLGNITYTFEVYIQIYQTGSQCHTSDGKVMMSKTVFSTSTAYCYQCCSDMDTRSFLARALPDCFLRCSVHIRRHSYNRAPFLEKRRRKQNAEFTDELKERTFFKR